MAFAHPTRWYWVLLAIAILLLYLWRQRRHRELVATDIFWARVFAGERLRMAWQRWRGTAAVLVHWLILALAVFALAELRAPAPRQMVLVVDNSASATRFEETKQLALRIAAGVRDCDRLAVITTSERKSGTVKACCGPSNDRALLTAVIGEIEVGPHQGQLAAALLVARFALDDAQHGTVVLLGEGLPTEVASTLVPATATAGIFEGVDSGSGGAGQAALVVLDPHSPDVRTRAAEFAAGVQWMRISDWVATALIGLLLLEWGLYQRRWLS
jgi:hypothetical protein